MIGTSDGEQYNSSFEHSIASTMGLGATEKPADALKTDLGTQVAETTSAPANDNIRGWNRNMSPMDMQFLGRPVSGPDHGKILPFKKSEGDGLPDPVKSVLSQPHIAEAIANPKIDRTHEVPYVAGASSKPDDFTTHVDKSVPSAVTISGKTFDPAVPLNIHEQVEREVMENLKKKGMSDEKAYEIAHHEFAEPAEDAWYKQQGIDVNEVNKWWKGIDQKTEKDKGDFPPTLYKAPYPHDKVEGIKHEPSNVNQEWAVSVPTPPERPAEATPRTANPIVDGKYDKLPMSENVEDRRQEIANMARNSKSIEDLINQITDMVHIDDPEVREKYFKDSIKNSDFDNPIGRKAGIVDLLHQLRVLNTMDHTGPQDQDWLKEIDKKLHEPIKK